MFFIDELNWPNHNFKQDNEYFYSFYILIKIIMVRFIFLLAK